MCTSPLDGWYSKVRGESGKRSVVFDMKNALHDRPVTVPCGRCMECRLRKKRDYALRCSHEASLHDENTWLTLTYDDENLPLKGSLRKKDVSGFLKRLRSRERRDADRCARRERAFKFFGCGEYGGKLDRAHYHLLLFGYCFDDAKYFTVQNGFKVYKSELLEEVWNRGICDIGEVSFDGMGYLAKYVTKKDRREEDVMRRAGYEPEFLLMSRGGNVKGSRGIGYDWYEKFNGELLAHDSCVVNGSEVSVPRYYDRQNEVLYPEALEKIKGLRKAGFNPDESRSSRLLSREKIVEGAVSLYQ